MTAPITGPYTKSEFLYDIPNWATGGTSAKAYSMSRKWFRQAKPYDLPLQFDFVLKRGSSRYTSTGPYGSYFGSNEEAISRIPDFPEQQGNLFNLAYSRFVSKMGESVELGVATAEGREALSMLTHRFGQLASFTHHLRRGQFGLAAGDLGIEWSGKAKKFVDPRIPKSLRPRSTRFREGTRSFSQLYLEAHFGWSPLLGDIYDAAMVLDRPIKPHHISASAQGSYLDPLNYAKSSQDASWLNSEGRDGRYEQKVTLRADVVVTNPNMATMQQWGVLNPLSIAWELVPFSFVLDWFVNVGDYLGSLTDLAGVDLLHASRTLFTRYSGSGYSNSIAKKPTSDNTSTHIWKVDTVHCFRRGGFGGGPSLRLRAPKPWGVRRGLAAASLLMQRFPRQVIDANAISLAKKRTAFRANVFPQFYGKYW